MPRPQVFLDTEAVTLELGPDVLWEIGLIFRSVGQRDAPMRWQIRPNMARANPRSLEISKFHDRFVVPAGAEAIAWLEPGKPLVVMTLRRVVHMLGALLEGASIYGMVPSFDTERLRLLFERFDVGAVWHYELHDVQDLAAGFLAREGTAARVSLTPPYDSAALSRAMGVAPPQEAHAALGDADWAQRLHDTVMGR